MKSAKKSQQIQKNSNFFTASPWLEILTHVSHTCVSLALLATLRCGLQNEKKMGKNDNDETVFVFFVSNSKCEQKCLLNNMESYSVQIFNLHIFIKITRWAGSPSAAGSEELSCRRSRSCPSCYFFS